MCEQTPLLPYTFSWVHIWAKPRRPWCRLTQHSIKRRQPIFQKQRGPTWKSPNYWAIQNMSMNFFLTAVCRKLQTHLVTGFLQLNHIYFNFHNDQLAVGLGLSCISCEMCAAYYLESMMLALSAYMLAFRIPSSEHTKSVGVYDSCRPSTHGPEYCLTAISITLVCDLSLNDWLWS